MKPIEHVQLSNGLNIYAVRTDDPIAQFQLYTPFGGDILSYGDPDTGEVVSLEPGCAHYFEHVLFIMPPLGKNGKPIKWRTNTPKKKKNLRDAMTELTRGEAIVVNAYTSKDVTNYHFATRKNKMQNLDLLLDFVMTPYLPQDRFAAEVGTILDEARRGQNSAGRVQYHTLNRQLFQSHGAQYPVIGTLESIPKISLESVLSLHKMFYRPSNMGLVAIGDIDIDTIALQAEQTLHRLGHTRLLARPQEIDQNEQRAVVLSDNFNSPIKRADVTQPFVLCGWKQLMYPLQRTTEESVDAKIVMGMVADMLFSRGSYGREKCIALGLDSFTFMGGSVMHRDHSLLYFEMKCDDVSQVEALRSYVSEVAQNGFTAQDFALAQKRTLLDFAKLENSIQMLGRALVGFGVQNDDPRVYELVKERTATLKLQQVNDSLEELFAPEKFSAVLMEPQ